MAVNQKKELCVSSQEAVGRVPSFVCVILVAFYPVAVRREGLEEVTAKLLKKIDSWVYRVCKKALVMEIVNS